MRAKKNANEIALVEAYDLEPINKISFATVGYVEGLNCLATAALPDFLPKLLAQALRKPSSFAYREIGAFAREIRIVVRILL